MAFSSICSYELKIWELNASEMKVSYCNNQTPFTVTYGIYLRLATVLTVVILALFVGQQKAPAEEKKTKMFSINIHSGHVIADNQKLQITIGDRVEIRWMSDKPVNLHLHGYDIHMKLIAGKTRSMIFDATISGRFPVGIHGTTRHGNIVYLEVHPR